MSVELVAKFEQIFHQKPEIHVRCPGRVNLVGEHIDYHGYGVLPMAITSSTTAVAARNNTNTINFVNTDPKYESWSSTIPCQWNGASPPKWVDYCLCGWKGIMRNCEYEQFGFSVLVTGDIPPSSGLSSSSSLVCATALVTLSLLTDNPFEKIPRSTFAQICADSEPLIGTLSGGMDQAAEVLATEGSALQIDFNPLKTRKIKLPNDAVFMVVHSQSELNKGATSHYNERVVEGRIVAQLIKKKYGIVNKTFRLKEVQDLLGKTLDQMIEISNELPEEVTLQGLHELLSKEEINECFSENTKHLDRFVLRPRARHVFSEARRVELFEIACAENKIERMGEIMNESHESCSVDYDCSTSDLDKLCLNYRNAGACGARLTGAGWGGCAVVLTSSENPEVVAEPSPLFICKPSAGIEVNYL